LKLVIENILTKEINVPLFNTVHEKGEGLLENFKRSLSIFFTKRVKNQMGKKKH